MDDDLKDKRKAILQATLELISDQGLQSTPMSQIAQRANTGIGTIYRYYPSKDDLINALYIEVKKQITSFVLQSYTEELPVRKAFKLVLGGLVRFFIENPKLLSFAEQYLNSPLISDATHEEGSRIIEPVTMLFQRAAEQDLLKPLPICMMGELIYSSIVTLAKYAINSKQGENQVDIDGGIDAIWDMVRL
jgi:TetR/AcrR family transcriptional regulator, repressor of fatR-cypB operon